MCSDQDRFSQIGEVPDLYWKVVLSNDEIVYRDCGDNTWLRLKSYCGYKNLAIKTFEVGFRSNKLDIAPAPGYTFCEGMTGTLDVSYHLWIIGMEYNKGKTLKRLHLIVPEIIGFKNDEVELDKYSKLYIPGCYV